MSQALDVIKSNIIDMLNDLGDIEYAISFRKKKNHKTNLIKYFSDTDEYNYEGVAIVQKKGPWLIDNSKDNTLSGKSYALKGKMATFVRTDFFDFILNNTDDRINQAYQPQSLPPNRQLPKAGLNPNDEYLIYLLWYSK